MSALRPARRAGFSLLEVMVAVAILALALGAIFASEAGAVKMAARARKTGIATLLVRCKMGEVEEEIANKGLPALFAQGTDGCCKEGEVEGFQCDWEIEPVLLPENMFSDQNQPTDASKKPGLPGSSATGASAASNPSALGAALSVLNPGATQGTPPPGQDPKNPNGQPGQGQTPLESLKNISPAEVLAGGGVGGLAALALSFVYPVLKPSFEAQIRRATVTVRWKEGTVLHKFDVTQYVVADQALMPGIDPTTGQPLPGQPGLTGAGLPATTPATPGIPGGIPGVTP